MSTADVVFRVERNTQYRTVPLFAISDDDRLSWKAVGIHTYLITRPPEWKFNKQDIINRHTEGEAAVRSGLKELRDYGYLHVTRVVGEDGKVVRWEWVVYEIPPYKQEKPDVDFPHVDNPLVDNPTYSKEGSVVSNEGKKYSSEAHEVFDYWEEARRTAMNVTQGRPMVKSSKRMGKVNARLKEGYTVDDLKAAVDGCLSSDYNVERGFTDIELICRDQKHVEQYLAWRKNEPSDGKPSFGINAKLEEFNL